MMKKVEKKVHRVKLTTYELRVAINALNEHRKKLREQGVDVADLESYMRIGNMRYIFARNTDENV